MMGSRYLIDSKVAHISESYANKCGISVDEAMIIFLGSTTYQALNDEETGLYLEVFEYVYDLFLDERGELSDE